jgi:hypothetical protein
VAQQSPTGAGSDPAWHQALAYAVTGRRIAELGRQARPDLAWLTDYLSRLASGADPNAAAYPRPDGRVPADLMAGIGPAQFWALLCELRDALDQAGPRRDHPVVADRPWSAEELRLMADRPPHHGS